jgi:hypothetical protein
MAVATVNTFRPLPARAQDFLAACSEAKKIHERLGGRVRIWRSRIGGEPLAIGYVVEHDDLARFAEFSSKLESDQEWQALWARAGTDPSATMIQSSLIDEVPLP